MAISLFLLVILGLSLNYFIFFDHERKRTFWKVYSILALSYNFFYYYFALYPKIIGSVDKRNWNNHDDLFYLAIFETLLLSIIGIFWLIKSRNSKTEKSTAIFGISPLIFKIILIVLLILNIIFIELIHSLGSKILIDPSPKEQKNINLEPIDKKEEIPIQIEWFTYENLENKISLIYPSNAVLKENLSGALLHLDLGENIGIEIVTENHSIFNMEEHIEKRIKELDLNNEYCKFINSTTKVINGHQFVEIEFQFPKLKKHLHEYIIHKDSIVYWIQTNSNFNVSNDEIEMIDKIINSFQFQK